MSQLLTTQQVVEYFGDPGLKRSTVDDAWQKKHVVYCGGGGRAELPVMPGVPPHFWFAVHRKVEAAMRRAFAAAAVVAPDYKIVRAGGYVYRHQRHDARRPLSRHSWGIAVDLNPVQNAAHDFPAGKTPPTWSPTWDAIWPGGVPRALVEAFETEGFVWGGRWIGFCDPMHFEYAQRPA